MKKFIFAAAVALAGAASLSPASAQPYGGCVVPSMPPAPAFGRHFGYDQRHHARCHAASWRLHHYERCAASDGRISRRERATIEELRSELRQYCRGWRWRG